VGTEPESPVAGTPMDRNHCTPSESGQRPRIGVVGHETNARVLVRVRIKRSGANCTRPGATIGVAASHKNTKSSSVRASTTGPG
jgi:hypothetical protein